MAAILAGDIGGTKTRLATVEVTGSQVHILREAGYASRDFATFELLLADFLAGAESPNGHARFPHPNPLPKGEGTNVSLRGFRGIAAAFGVAGPVEGRVAQTTNLPWRIDADALQQQFGFSHCTLLNDLEATAYGLSALCPDDLLTLQAGGVNATGNAAVIAAGTGLGEAGLYWDGQQHQPFATEGGHASFSPGNELEMALLRHLQQQHSHVSWERVVSGMGLLTLHEFLRQYRQVSVPGWLAEEMRHGDAAAAISKAAMAGRDEICSETLHCFVSLYGAEAGNLALKVMSCGGLYLGGGIAPRILPLLTDGVFLEAFLNKGRMRHLLEAMPVKVILNDRAALYGPALRAAQLAGMEIIHDMPNAQAVFVHDDPMLLGAAVAERISRLADEAISERGVFHLALAGGETPRRCYEQLRHHAIDWLNVHIYFGDERCLPKGDAQRNDSMARNALFEHVALPEGNIHVMQAELGAAEAAARYMMVLNGIRLDLVLLGMGEDGHTASLFPGNPAIASADAVVPVYQAPKPPAERVSLGMSTLNAARAKLFLVAGEGKRSALERILLGETLPAAQVAGAEWHFDRAALPITTEEY